jgi:hypothetical protein
MKLFIDRRLDPGWFRAAKYLDYPAKLFSHTRLVETVAGQKDGVVIIDSASTYDYQPLYECLQANPGVSAAIWCEGASGVRALKAFGKMPLYLTPLEQEEEALTADGYNALWVRPAADVDPNCKPGTPRAEFRCDAAFVGAYRPEYEKYLSPLCKDSGLNVKIFGTGPYPYHQYLGQVPAEDVPDIYASAKVSLDIGGNPQRALAIVAAGGTCASTTQYRERLDALSKFPAASDPTKFVSLVESLAEAGGLDLEAERNDVLTYETFTDRLGDVLEKIFAP